MEESAIPFNALKHPRVRGGKFGDSAGGPIALKGRGGKAVKEPTADQQKATITKAASRLKKGDLLHIPLPEGSVQVRKTGHKFSGAQFEVTGGGHHIDPEMRRGDRYAPKSLVGDEVVERVRNSKDADAAHTAQVAAEVHANGEAKVGSVKVAKKGDKIVTNHSSYGEVEHPSLVHAIRHAKVQARADGHTFLKDDGGKNDPLAHSSAHKADKLLTAKERLDTAKEDFEKADGAYGDVVPDTGLDWAIRAEPHLQGPLHAIGMAGPKDEEAVTSHASTIVHQYRPGHSGGAAHAMVDTVVNHPAMHHALAMVNNPALHHVVTLLHAATDDLHDAERSGEYARIRKARAALIESYSEAKGMLDKLDLSEAGRGARVSKVMPGPDPRVKNMSDELPDDAPPDTESAGVRVMQLQRRLDSLGFDTLDDGKFGKKTAESVKGFQRNAMLKDDGIVGPITTAALKAAPSHGDMYAMGGETTPGAGLAADDFDGENSLGYDADVSGDGGVGGDGVTQMGDTVAEDPAAEDPGAPTKGAVGKSPSNATLYKGMGVGDRAGSKPVREVQAALGALGHDINVDGRFGPETQKHVKRFQRKMGLNPDGMVGPRTARAMKGVQKKSAQLKEALDARQVAMGSDAVRLTARVIELRRQLDEGFSTGMHPRARGGKFADVPGKGNDAEHKRRDALGIGKDFDKFYDPDPEKEFAKRTTATREYAARADGQRSPATGPADLGDAATPTLYEINKLKKAAREADQGNAGSKAASFHAIEKLGRMTPEVASQMDDAGLADLYLGYKRSIPQSAGFHKVMRAEIAKRQKAGSKNTTLHGINPLVEAFEDDAHPRGEGGKFIDVLKGSRADAVKSLTKHLNDAAHDDTFDVSGVSVTKTIKKGKPISAGLPDRTIEKVSYPGSHTGGNYVSVAAGQIVDAAREKAAKSDGAATTKRAAPKGKKAFEHELPNGDVFRRTSQHDYTHVTTATGFKSDERTEPDGARYGLSFHRSKGAADKAAASWTNRGFKGVKAEAIKPPKLQEADMVADKPSWMAGAPCPKCGTKHAKDKPCPKTFTQHPGRIAEATDSEGAWEPNSKSLSLKDIPIGAKFAAHDGSKWILHQAAKDPFMIVKPDGGGKPQPMHKMYAPTKLAGVSDGYSAEMPRNPPADRGAMPGGDEVGNMPDAVPGVPRQNVASPTAVDPMATKNGQSLKAYRAAGGRDPAVMAALSNT